MDKNEFKTFLRDGLQAQGQTLSEAELDTVVDKAFKHDDTDGNGTLSLKEVCDGFEKAL